MCSALSLIICQTESQRTPGLRPDRVCNPSIRTMGVLQLARVVDQLHSCVSASRQAEGGSVATASAAL